MAKEKNIKHLTLLHSNDMHGDFLTEDLDSKLVGGVALLSGYVNQVRNENPNTLYMIAGDMFRGSLIDSEYKGISTIEIMNLLAPDIVSLGNHEMDYGIAHLLFLEKCCKFPIVNANIYIRSTGMRLFNSHQILRIDGMNILVIGILTEDIMNNAKKDELLGTFVSVNDAAKEVGIICNSYKEVDIDFTILLTHIGFAEDKKLAAMLNPEWGIDVIVGGHSHTILEQPEKVNDILIVQAGIGTNQIGRFEINVDTDSNSVDNYTWELVPINNETSMKNKALEELIFNYKEETDKKYGRILTQLTTKALHPSRYQETAVGNLFSDAIQEGFDLDLALIASGALRNTSFGPIVTAGDLLTMFPFGDSLNRFILTGKELKEAVHYFLKNTVGTPGSDNEFYQVSRGFHFEYSLKEDRLLSAKRNGKEIKDEETFKVAMESYHLSNIQKFLGLNPKILLERAPYKVVSSNGKDFMEEYFLNHTHLSPKVEGRIVVL